MKRRFQSVGAVLAGAIAGIILSLGTDTLLPKQMTGPLFVLATTYRTVYGVFGAYLTGRLAPRRPLFHALVLGALGSIANLAGVMVALNKPELGPLWYPIALLVLGMPTAWAGGKLVKPAGEPSA